MISGSKIKGLRAANHAQMQCLRRVDVWQPKRSRRKGTLIRWQVPLVEQKPRANAQQQSDDEDTPSTGLEVQAEHRCGFVAVVGKPNVGKSSLVNALAGDKLSIVTRKANTTRQSVLALVSSDSYQAVLIDTPGVMAFEQSTLDATMMANMRRSVADADCVILLLDGSKRPIAQLHELAPVQYRPLASPCLVAINKADLLSENQRDDVLHQLAKEDPPAGKSLLVSSKTGENVVQTLQWIVSHLPDGPALYPKDLASEHNERFFVSEMIREKALELYDQEVPYAMFVSVPYFKERPSAKDYVLAEITVERESQKAIVLGHKGQMLKKLSTDSRHAIEDFLGRLIYLELKVRVQSKWRKRNVALKHYESYDKATR